MIIWSGAGILVAVLAAAGAFLGTMLLPGAGWGLGVGVMLAGGATHVLNWFLYREPARVLVDTSSGEEVRVEGSHSLYFVSTRYWTFILAGLGLVLVLMSLSGDI
jgi:hypothetical protein